MLSIIGFSVRIGRASYGLFTLAFAAVVLGVANGQGGTPFSLLVSEPWSVLGRSLDDLIRLDELFLDLLASFVIAGAILWVFTAMTVRRLRDVGQSPWWTALVLLSGIVVPAMIVLSLLPPTMRTETRGARAALMGLSG